MDNAQERKGPETKAWCLLRPTPAAAAAPLVLGGPFLRNKSHRNSTYWHIEPAHSFGTSGFIGIFGAQKELRPPSGCSTAPYRRL
jgi:hypothetical protein